MPKRLQDVQSGDRVVRWLGGKIRMPLRVTAVTEQLIDCSGWTFDRVTGAEVDDVLGWGPPPLETGSYLVVED